jgi:hypothetical protein
MLVKFSNPLTASRKPYAAGRILDHFEYRWPFSDSQRCKSVCVHKNYDFTVQCNAYLGKNCAKVTILVAYHNCAGNALAAWSQASWVDWLEQVVLTILKVNVKHQKSEIVDADTLDMLLKIQQAQCVRCKGGCLWMCPSCAKEASWKNT